MTRANFHVSFMKGCCVYSSSVKQCLRSVNHEQFLQMTHKHNEWLQILAQEDFHRNSSERERRLQKQRRRSREQETEEPREPTSFPGSLSHLNEVAERTSLSLASAIWHSEGNTDNKRQRNRGRGDWNMRGIMIVLHCGKPKLPIYRSTESLRSFSSVPRPEVY